MLLETTDIDPFERYEQIRSSGPVVWEPDLNGWLVTPYDLCREVLADEVRFEEGEKFLSGTHAARGRKRSLAVLTGDEHRKLHRFLANPLHPRNAREYRRTVIGPIVDDEAARLAERGPRVDLAAEFADRIPLRVILALLGIDDPATVAEVRRLRDIQSEFDNSAFTDTELIDAAAEAATALRELLMPEVLERETEPRDDLLSWMWTGGRDVFPDWCADEVYAAVSSYITGGGTAKFLLRNVIHEAIARPGLKGHLLADLESRAPLLVDEVLRFYGVGQWLIRRATGPTELAGTPIAEGDFVLPLVAATGRDADAFLDPDDLDIDDARSAPHLTFGYGPRFCIGATLVRSIGVETIRGLFDAFPDVRFDDTEPEPRLRGFQLRSYHPLPCVLGAFGSSS